MAKIAIHVFDSYKSLELPSHRVFAVTYEPMWQGIRASMNFRDAEGTTGSLAKLEAYLSLARGDEELRCRVFRVGNLLNSLPLGVKNWDGISKVPYETERLIVPYRRQIAERALAVGKPTQWDWHTSRKQLKIVVSEHPREFKAILTKLKSRAARKEPKTELRYYLTLIEEVTIGTT